MGILKSLQNIFRRSDRIVESRVVVEKAAPSPSISAGPTGSGQRLRAALGGAFSGQQISNHWEEAGHNEGFTFVAVSAIAEQMHAATTTVYADGQNQDKYARKRKALRSRWEGWGMKADYGAEEAFLGELDVDHPLVQLMRRPSPYEPGGMFRFRQALQIRLTGGCYIWNVPSMLTTKRAPRGQVCERYVIPTTSITPVYPSPDLPFGGYRIQPNCMRWVAAFGDDQGYINGNPVLSQVLGMIIDAREVQKVGYPHPIWLDDFQSPVSAGAQWVDAERAINIARAKTAQRGVDPSIHVALPADMKDLGQDQMDRYQLQFERKYGGPDNVGRPLVTAPGTLVTTLSGTPKDMGYKEGFEDTKNAILANHKTPPVAIGMQEAGAYAAYYASSKSWRNNALKPLCGLLAESDTFHLAPQFGEGLTVEMVPLPIDDEDEKIRKTQALGQLKVLRRDEIRVEYGWAPVGGPEGEEFVGGASAAGAGPGDANKPNSESKPPGVPGVAADPKAPDSPNVVKPDVPKPPAVSKVLAAAFKGFEDADGEYLANKLDELLERRLSAFKSVGPHKFATTQVQLPDEFAQSVMQFGRMIPDDYLAEDGRETDIHCTIKYGLHDPDPRSVIDAVQQDFRNVLSLETGKISHFTCDGYDVIKIDVSSPSLSALNQILTDNCECTTTHPEYLPHITIAYVKSGLAAQFDGADWFAWKTFDFDRFTFANQAGKRSTIPLTRIKSIMGLSTAIGSDGGATVRKTSIEEAIRSTAECLQDHPGRMPGYGQVYLKDGEVWYVGGDSDSREFYKEVESRFAKIVGADNVRYEAEGFPPEDDGWQQVFPAKKSNGHKSNGAEHWITINGAHVQVNGEGKVEEGPHRLESTDKPVTREGNKLYPGHPMYHFYRNNNMTRDEHERAGHVLMTPKEIGNIVGRKRGGTIDGVGEELHNHGYSLQGFGPAGPSTTYWVSHHGKSTRKSTAKSERWITIDGDHGGGTHIKISDDGTILSGPADLAHKGIRHISDFGENPRGSDEHIQEMIPHAHEYLLNQHEERERAKQSARKITGLTAGDISRHENAYRDHSTVENFDTSSRTVAMEHPELGFDPDAHDTPARVWEFIREGAQKKPTKNSPEVRDLAREWSTQQKPRHRVAQETVSAGPDW